jgi:teichoic acid transport system permease protein
VSAAAHRHVTDTPARAIVLPEGFQPLQLGIDSATLRVLAEYNGLYRMDTRTPLGRYLANLWRRRGFIWTLARSKVYAKNRKNYLGQLWNVLTPFLNALVLVFIFGLILQTSRGMANGLTFIIVGSFTYDFFSRTVSIGAASLHSNLGLVRSVRFPRAVLPISQTLTELIALIPAFLVMCGIVWACSFVPGYAPSLPTWRWALLPVALLIYAVFTLGCVFMTARWVTFAPDLQNIIRFITRLLMYVSGVMFSIPNILATSHIKPIVESQPFGPFIEQIALHQPLAIFIEMARSCILSEPTIPLNPMSWALGAGWAVLFAVVGFVYFWRAEHRYGRS